MDDALVRNSLAYRKNEAAILRGDVPEKYTRLLPFIPRGRILEIGSAEGVLALLLAKRGDKVTAVERRQDRHDAALALRDAWLDRGPFPEGAETRHVCGDAVEAVNLVEPGAFDVLVGVRCIYYFGNELDYMFATIAEKIPSVVLCGNANRARWWKEGLPNRNDRADNYYASADGMRDVLRRHGFRIVSEVLEGDPIVVGAKG